MRFAMTARTLANLQDQKKEINDLTAKNIAKVTRYREGGEDSLREMVEKIKSLELGDRNAVEKRFGGRV